MYKVWIGVIALLLIVLGLLGLYIKSFNRHQEAVNDIAGEWEIRLPEGQAPAYLTAMSSPMTFRPDGTGSLGKSKTFRWDVKDQTLIIDGNSMPILKQDHGHLTYRSPDGPVELAR